MGYFILAIIKRTTNNWAEKKKQALLYITGSPCKTKKTNVWNEKPVETDSGSVGSLLSIICVYHNFQYKMLFIVSV